MSRVAALTFIEPQLPSLVEQPPEEEWVHEVKHDGYRTLLAVQRGKVVAYTRKGYDWTDRYRGIAAAAARLRCKSAMLDPGSQAAGGGKTKRAAQRRPPQSVTPETHLATG